MIVVTRICLLAVGIDNKQDFLRKLPVKTIRVSFGNEAISSFKNNRVGLIISPWNLPDMPDGKLLKGIKKIKPDMPIIAVIDEDDISSEIQARSLGVSAVITQQSGDELLIELVSEILGIDKYLDLDSHFVNEENSNIQNQ